MGERYGLPVVNPVQFVPGYKARVDCTELGILELERRDDTLVLAIVGQSGTAPTLNLKAPIVVNRRCRLGCQVLAQGEWPLKYELSPRSQPATQPATQPLKKSA